MSIFTVVFAQNLRLNAYNHFIKKADLILGVFHFVILEKIPENTAKNRMNNDEDWQHMSSVGRWNQKDNEGVCESADLRY